MTASVASVFIVDDSALVREMVAEYLELDPALRVTGEAGSGEEALDLLPGAACDLVLVDVSMPGMNGIELVRRVVAAFPGLPCVIYSAHAEEVYVRQAREAGASGYVMKGRPERLSGAIHAVLDGGEHFAGALDGVSA